MSMAAKLEGDPLQDFVGEVEQSLARLKKALAEQPLPCGSRALAFAMQAGLPPRMAYTVPQTAMYTGVSKETLKAEADAGRIAFFKPNGKERYSMVKVDEVDRWLSEN